MNKHTTMELAALMLRQNGIVHFRIEEAFPHRNSFIVILDDGNEIVRCRTLIAKWKPLLRHKSTWNVVEKHKPWTGWRDPKLCSMLRDPNKGGKKFRKARAKAEHQKIIEKVRRMREQHKSGTGIH